MGPQRVSYRLRMDETSAAHEAIPRELADYLRADPLAALLGIELEHVSVGYARARMAVGSSLLNAQGAAHGGAMMTLIDVVHAAVSNSHGTRAVAVDVHTEFLHAAVLGDELVCESAELSRGRRTAVYRIGVRRVADDRPIAEALARVFRSDDPVLRR